MMILMLVDPHYIDPLETLGTREEVSGPPRQSGEQDVLQ